jgi:hypothetical protein
VGITRKDEGIIDASDLGKGSVLGILEGEGVFSRGHDDCGKQGMINSDIPTFIGLSSDVSKIPRYVTSFEVTFA